MQAAAMHAARVERGRLEGIVPIARATYTLSPALVDAFLEKLGLERTIAWSPADLETLTRLQHAFVDRVAYENVSLHSGPGSRPDAIPRLDPVASTMRIIGGRGCYCFVLVDAYAALLTSLGFTVSLHVGGVGLAAEAAVTFDARLVNPCN